MQRPASRAKERDERLVAAWRRHTWSALKKQGAPRGRTIALWAETGHTFRIRLNTTWARRAQTPGGRRLSRRREISSIVVVTPAGRLYAQHQAGAVNGRAVPAALPYFRRQLGTPLLIIWDRLNAHRTRAVRQFVSGHARDYAVAYLPACAPELNPEKQANAWVKRRMANTLPPSITALATLARTSFRQFQARPVLIRHFFQHVGLHVKAQT